MQRYGQAGARPAGRLESALRNRPQERFARGRHATRKTPAERDPQTPSLALVPTGFALEEQLLRLGVQKQQGGAARSRQVRRQPRHRLQNPSRRFSGRKGLKQVLRQRPDRPRGRERSDHSNVRVPLGFDSKRPAMMLEHPTGHRQAERFLFFAHLDRSRFSPEPPFRSLQESIRALADENNAHAPRFAFQINRECTPVPPPPHQAVQENSHGILHELAVAPDRRAGRTCGRRDPDFPPSGLGGS